MFTSDDILAAIIFGKGGGGGKFKYTIGTSADDTPEGIAFYKGSTVITGTLPAADAKKNRIYLVPSDNGDNDRFDEYIATKNENGEYVWERIGNEDIDIGVANIKGEAETEFRDGDVIITKANIGLGNVDNTSDLDKPVSTATQDALKLKTNLTNVAHAFDEANSYNVGDIVVYDGSVLKFIRNHSAGPIQNGETIQAVLADEIERAASTGGGGSGEDYGAETMTMAEYQGLSDSEKMDGKVRYITDVYNLLPAEGVGF